MSDKQHENATTSTAPSQHVLRTVIGVCAVFFVLTFVLIKFVSPTPPAKASTPAEALAKAQRLQKVGTIQIRDADRPLRSGEEVYQGQCFACHASGVSGAPKLGDAGEWGPRLGQGFDGLLHAALKGKGAMAPQGGGEFNDFEIARAVVYMANAGGGHFPEPEAPANEASAP